MVLAVENIVVVAAAAITARCTTHWICCSPLRLGDREREEREEREINRESERQSERQRGRHSSTETDYEVHQKKRRATRTNATDKGDTN